MKRFILQVSLQDGVGLFLEHLVAIRLCQTWYKHVPLLLAVQGLM